MALLDTLSHLFGKRTAAPQAPEPRQPEAIQIDGALSEEQNISNLQRALDSGADVKAKLWANQSPLCVAAASGMQKVAGFLIDHGAEINPQGQETPFIAATGGFQPDMMKFLVDHGADPKQPDGIPQDAMIKFFLAHDWDHRKDPDFPARDRACMQFLLDHGLTPPDWAKSRAYTERKALWPFFPDLEDVKTMEEAGKQGDFQTVRQMIANGMHPDEPARCGGTSPIAYAIRNDDVQQVRFLLFKGADVEQRSGDLTPIMHAAREGAKLSFIELLRAGADTSKMYAADRYEDTTVLDLAQQCKKSPDMKAFAEDMIAHRDNLPPPPELPDIDVAVEHKISVHHSLKLKPGFA